MALRVLLISAAMVAAPAGAYSRDHLRLDHRIAANDPRLTAHACELSSCYPATGNLLIGRESRLSASSTCGLHGHERYCIVSHLEPKKCFWCDSTNNTLHNPNLNHRIQNVIYKYYPGTRTKSWWQSENGKENVTIQLDMEAEFHFTHLIIQFKTFRPAAMLVERSFDFGKTWRVYRYFAHNCDEFPVPRYNPRSISEVVCVSRYSDVAPSSEGEVIFRVLPPNINVTNPYSEEVQNLLRMTNLRINFTKLHTLGDDKLDNRAEIQEKYYYAIYEMTVRGSCSCYGHASRCLPMPGVESKIDMVHGRCECTHNTRGLNCEYCEDFYNDLPWQPAVGKTSNACKRCTCNNHASTCHFDPAVYNKTGKISGGVCDNCQHNTMGVNCERCKPKYFKDPNLDIQSPDICKPCDCDPEGTTDQEILCDDETDLANNKTAGRCLCKTYVDGPRCDRCKDGYWNFDPRNPEGCEACTCDSLGTINERGCDPATGICFCKRHVTGRNCDQCLPEFYGLSDSDDGCLPCDCDVGGSLDRDCDVITGQCKCRPNVTGRKCDQPIQNFFVGALDSISVEAESSQCDSQIDDNAIQSQLCHVVIRENFPDLGKITWTGPGFMKVPESSTLVFVINNLKRSMNYNVLIRYEPQSSHTWEEATILVKRPQPDPDSPCYNVRPEADTVYTKLPANQRSVLTSPPICLEKDKETEIRIYLGRQDGVSTNSRASILIDSIVLIPSLDDLPFFANRSSMRDEFDRYNCGDSYYYSLNRENVPDICKKYHASIGFYIRNGSQSCQCDPSGSKSHQCDPYTGNCQCVENIVGPRCDRCAPGTYGFSKFGCKRCDCNSIGSLDNFCDVTSGQCKCRANTYGRACDLCQPGYFNFPNCQQCDCNGHAIECDDKTGACKECRDYTEGHRCERCVEGYYGDPRLGVDIPCRPCPCPGVKGDLSKSSHADRCELDPETKDVVCECKEGYAGLLCDVCADNYYGDPVKGTCKKCECNENIDLTKPGNCDPYTGKCLQCLYNTAGENCEVCEEGYYGDALNKECYKCNCSKLGTNFTNGNCDGITGQCPCYNNVMGINCDQCTENHWRIALGKGCDPCDCDPIGSLSPQCNPYVGKCECKPGHGGRQCDQCQENYWGDPNVECYECDCNLYGSVSRQCMRENGSCICKPGIGGYKCDMCARGYLGEAPQCYACGECFDNWDNIINDLKLQTEFAIANASKIKVVGATGAYTRDFDEMTKKLAEVENLLSSAKAGQTTIVDLLSNVTSLQNYLNEAEKKIKNSNDNLNAVTYKINLGNVTLDGLRSNIEKLKTKTQDLGNNATKLQEANLEGALNLTREAKERAIKAADDAENVQNIIANTDRQIKNTDRLIEMQYAHFNKSQNDNDKKLDELTTQLQDLESQIPKLNEKMCGQESDSCDICGGAGCGKCGGISCDQGAVTKAVQALDFANKTEHRIKDHELTAEDLFRSISQVKQDTVAVRSRANDLFNKAQNFKLSSERVTNESQDLTAELKEFLSNTSNTPTDVRTLANDILNLSIRIEPKEITELSQRINNSVSQLTNIENIITETKPDLERAKSLKQNATAVNKAANLTLEMANKVLEALDEAQAAQDAAENAIEKANNDIEAAKSDLVPIAVETEQAQKKANETKDEVEKLRLRLSDLQKNTLKIESDAEQVKQEANDVVNRAEGAEQLARQLRQKFKHTNMSLAERASQTANSRETAQLLLDRATKLASDTQMKLKLLANMEELYNDHNEQLNTLEKEIGDLNTQMNYYLSEITKRSDIYRSCTTWLYLEPILCNADDELGVKFRRVDQGFRQAARVIEADPRLSALLHAARLQNMLDGVAEQLRACQSALNTYIDEKRLLFPRFYFLSNDDLLEVLGGGGRGGGAAGAVLRAHLRKLFPGAGGARLGPGGSSLTALTAEHGDELVLEHPVDIDCPVEVWLKNLETEMRSTLKSMTLKCLMTSSLQEQDPFALPIQILCLAQNIRFTEQTERAITSRELHKLMTNIEKENAYYLSTEAEDQSESNKRQALILQCVHYISIVKSLIDNNVTTLNDWQWQKQLRLLCCYLSLFMYSRGMKRFYLMSTKEVVAKMGLAQITYSYEYLGINTAQFVRTQLADELFLTLTQSLHLGFVGNPFGPAGTGKTESVKALGALFGRLVLVFNCDESMDGECMGRLLSGLALCGAWGCFDELNRLSADTLNTVAHQLGSLLGALQSKRSAPEPALLNGNKVYPVEWCGVLCTLNPAGRGYVGRRALCGGVSRALRPHAARAPPPALLAGRLLAPHTPHATILAQHMHDVFTMAGALVCGERHYDWGVRALKAGVVAAGALLSARGAPRDLPAQRALLRRSLAHNNVSKLTKPDKQIFESILSLVFADVAAEDAAPHPIHTAIETSARNLKLVYDEAQAEKCVQLYEQLQQRMGVALVGGAGSGKTTIRRLLKDALSQRGESVVEYVISPKSMTREALLGSVHPDTRQWTDGVISATALDAVSQPTDVHVWVVLDGDVEAGWVEALNSVLDDNRLLALAAGCRVQFTPNVRFIFETHHLRHASPATVSRLAIILLSDDSNCDLLYLEQWMRTYEVDNECMKPAVSLLCDIVPKCLQWINEHKSDIVLKIQNITLVKQIITQFEYIICNETFNKTVSCEEIVSMAIERSMMSLVKDSAVDGLRQELSAHLGPSLPSLPTISEWVGDALLTSERLAPCERALRACLASNSAHLLIIGPDACAKNLVCEYVIKETNSPLITIECTPILEPEDIIEELKRHNVVRAGGRGGGPSAGERATLLLRGLHRAHHDEWGISAVHCFILQLISRGGFWSVNGGACEWWGGGAVRVVCTARAHPHPRLAAALQQYMISEPEDEEIKDLTEGWLSQSVGKHIKGDDVRALSGTLLNMYKEITDTFTSRPHYRWNNAHLRMLCENVKWYSPSDMEQLLMALTSEANLIFGERLLLDDEKYKCRGIVKCHLKVKCNEMYYSCKLRADGVHMEAVEYGAWREHTQRVINQCLSEHDYNVFGTSVSEVCTELAVLAPAIARTLNGGVLLCVGAAGVGRRCAALLAAGALSAQIHFIHNHTHFNNILKNAVVSASEGTRSLVVVSGAGAEGAALAALQAVVAARTPRALPHALRPLLHEQQHMDNVKRNLGIVICLDARQSDLQDLLERFPFMYDDGNLVWIDTWTDNTLREMPTLVIERLLKDSGTEVSKELMSSIPVDGFIEIYKSLERESLKTPLRYVTFIRTYHHILNKKKAALVQRKNMLTCGVEALDRAHSKVLQMSEEAALQEGELSLKRAEASEALDQITAAARATADRREQMQLLKRDIEKENEQLQIQKKEIEAELASVEPIIAAARSAVGEIRPEALSEMRSLRAPPDVVRDVLEGVLRLMGIADTSWHSMKSFLAKRGVKEDIRCLDAAQIPESAVASVQQLLARRGASFEASTARRASAACAPLAAWVTANLHYATALRRVQPLQDHQRDLMQRLQSAEAQMSALAGGLAGVEARVAELKEAVGERARAAADLEHRLQRTHRTLHTARALTEQLQHEHTQWKEDLQHIVKEISDLSSRSLLAAAYIVYLPDATEPQAKVSIDKWSSFIDFDDETFSVINFLSTTEKQLKWEADGLPSDMSAVKNAVLIDQYLDSPKCGLTPLLIDPDGEGLAWLRSTLPAGACDFISQNSDTLLTAVQYATRLGRTLVITDVDGVHESWAPVLAGLPVGGGGGGAAQCRLLLHTRDGALPSRLPPYHADTLAVVPFTARLDGLTDQMINCALEHRSPELSAKVKELKVQKAEVQRRRHELQEELLRQLSGAGDVLQDEGVARGLEASRASADSVSAALVHAEEAAREAREAAARLRGAARRAAALALRARALGSVHPALSLTLRELQHMFLQALHDPEGRERAEAAAVQQLTVRLVERVVLSVHRRHKYGVVMHLLRHAHHDIIPDPLWQLFIGNYNSIEVDTNALKKDHPWIPSECLNAVANLQLADGDLYSRLSLDKCEMWSSFVSHGEWSALGKLRLGAFERLLVVAVFRPEGLYRAIVAFVDEMLEGGACVRGTPAARCVRGVQCARARPLLLRARHAADALQHAHAHAHVHTTLNIVAVEQGVEACRAAVEGARGAGGWVAIDLAGAPFNKQLQAFIVECAREAEENPNINYQLWILTEDRDVPPLVANACVNVILEVAEGVKNNVLSTVSAWGEYRGAGGAREAVRLHAALALLHALVQERRNYIPLGWSRWYEWEWSEVRACSAAVRGGGPAPLLLAWYAAPLARAHDTRALTAIHARTLRGQPIPLPHADNLQAFAASVASLPDVDSPELLGLPENCHRARDRKAAQAVIDKLKQLESSTPIEEKDVRVNSSRSLASAWKKWMSGSPLLRGEGWEGVAGAGGGWWGGAARGEARAAAALARTLHAHLAQHARDAHAQPLTQVPEEWQLQWAGPEEPLLYLREFCARAHAAVQRLDTHIADDYMPKEVDLRGWVHAARAVWALRAHEAARRNVHPHTLALTATFIQQRDEVDVSDGIVVTGLRVSGGACGRGGLRPATAAEPPTQPALPMLLTCIQQEEDSPAECGGLLEVPVYSNEQRDELVFTALAPLEPTYTLEAAILHTLAFYIAPID